MGISEIVITISDAFALNISGKTDAKDDSILPDFIKVRYAGKEVYYTSPREPLQ